METRHWFGLGCAVLAAYAFTHRSPRSKPVTPNIFVAGPRVIPIAALPTTTLSTISARGLPYAATRPARSYTADDVLNLDTSGNERVEAMYQLTQAGARAATDLRRIVATPIPKDPSRQALDVSLRITALEALDQLAKNGVDVRDAFLAALSNQTNGSLQTMALIGLNGIAEGRPGKIKRFIDEMVAQR